MTWNLFGALAPQAMDAGKEDKIKNRKDSVDFGVEPDQESNTPTILEFPLQQDLLNQVRVGEDNKVANSGKQACRDLPTMAFIINNIGIPQWDVKRWCESLPEGSDHLAIAEYAFTKMFESVPGMQTPKPRIMWELITSCNQAGYEALIYDKIHPVFAQYKLIPTIPEKTISIRCNSVNSLSVEYSEVIVIKNSDPDQLEQYKANSKLEFTLKLQNGKIEYENGKVTLTVPEELKSYHVKGKSLVDEISEHFADRDLIASHIKDAMIEEPKSLVADLVGNSSDDEGLSFVEISGSLADLEELVQNAVQDKGNGITALRSYVKSIEASVVHAQPEVVDNLIQILNQFLQEKNAGRGTYPTFPPGAEHVYAAIKWVEGTLNGNISDEEYKGLIDKLNNLRKLLEDKKNITTPPVAAAPVVTNSAVPETASDGQAEKNILATGEKGVIINTGSVCGEENDNSLKENVMGKNTKSIQEKLSYAIKQISCSTVKFIIKQNDADVTEHVLSEAFDEATKIQGTLKKGKNKTQKKLDKQEQNLIEIIAFLNGKLSSIRACTGEPLVSDDGSLGTIASSQLGGEFDSNATANDQHDAPISVTQPKGDPLLIEANGRNTLNTETSEAPAPISDDDIQLPVTRQPNDTQSNNKNSKWPIVTALIFTATGVGVLTYALCMPFVLEASLLATGVVAAIGACCLVAAAIVYCCGPKSSGQYNSVTDVGEGKLAVS